MARVINHKFIMDAQSTDETESTVLGPAIAPQIHEGAIYVVWSAGVTAGVVEIEDAHREDYTGTWSTMGTVTFATADKVDRMNYTGTHMAVRARISTAVSGGTVSVFFLGQG